MTELIGALLGTSLGGLLGLLWVTTFVLYFGLPIMAFSAMRSVKGINRQLEVLNETLGTKMTITKSGPLGL